MRIALIDVNYRFSSTGKIVSDLKHDLEKNGHNVIAFYGRGKNVDEENVIKISSKLEVIFHALATRITGLVDIFSPFATYKLISNLKKFKPDVVHLHDIHGYFVNIYQVVEYLKSSNIPVVWTFHCEYMYTGKCGYTNDCHKWQTQCDNCPQLHEYPDSWFFDFTKKMYNKKAKLFKNFDKLHITSPSNWLADRIKKSIVANKKISVVHNGLDESVFCIRKTTDLLEHYNLQGKFIVLSVGANLLSERKGGKWVLDIARNINDPGIIFIMIGIDKIPPALPGNIITVQTINDQELLSKYYSMANVLLLTSSKETFSMVCAESLACGTPIIGFDSGAPKEVAPQGYGEFVQYADTKALYNLIIGYKSGSVGLLKPGQCQEFAHANYSKEKMMRSYSQIYKNLINDAG